MGAGASQENPQPAALRVRDPDTGKLHVALLGLRAHTSAVWYRALFDGTWRSVPGIMPESLGLSKHGGPTSASISLGIAATVLLHNDMREQGCIASQCAHRNQKYICEEVDAVEPLTTSSLAVAQFRQSGIYRIRRVDACYEKVDAAVLLFRMSEPTSLSLLHDELQHLRAVRARALRKPAAERAPARGAELSSKSEQPKSPAAEREASGIVNDLELPITVLVGVRGTSVPLFEALAGGGEEGSGASPLEVSAATARAWAAEHGVELGFVEVDDRSQASVMRAINLVLRGVASRCGLLQDRPCPLWPKLRASRGAEGSRGAAAAPPDLEDAGSMGAAAAPPDLEDAGSRGAAAAPPDLEDAGSRGAAAAPPDLEDAGSRGAAASPGELSVTDGSGGNNSLFDDGCTVS